MATKTGNKMDMRAIMDWFENRPTNKKMRDKLAHFVKSRMEFVGGPSIEPAQMLDYACGDGYLSRLFAPHVSFISAIDISPVMVDMYNARIDDLGPAHKDTRALVGDLLAEPTSPPDFNRTFHLITLGAALHAFPDPQDAVKRLVAHLNPGGVLFIQDILFEGDAQAKNRPHGFTAEGLEKMMTDACLKNFEMEVLPEELEIELLTEEKMCIRCFLARGTKGHM